jgi:hypothetical protein
MGELSEEPEAPVRTVNHDELSLGMIVPGAGAPKRATERAEALRRAIATAPPRTRVPMPKLVGENATVLGWIVPRTGPAPASQAVPLIANSREDYRLVRSLLSEHYSAFEPQVDYEYDDTDPSHKDFLFGPIAWAVGALARGDGPLGTFRLALGRRRFFAELYERFLGWPSAMVGDAYVALNGGMHALIQYLQHLRAFDASFMTARASTPELIEVSKGILDEAEHEKPEGVEAQALRPTPRNRLLWVRRFFHAPLAAPRFQWRRRLVAAAVLVALLGLSIELARQAIIYRPIYRARMAALQEPGAIDVRTEER